MLIIITLIICIVSTYVIIATICTYSKPSTSMIQRHAAVDAYWNTVKEKDTGIVRYSKPRYKDTSFVPVYNNNAYGAVAQKGE